MRNWDNFYRIVKEGKTNLWEIKKQFGDKSVFLFKRDGSGFTWMINSRHEINAYNSLKQGAKGDILMAGLGIGYEPFILCDRQGVKSIDIVECDEEIIYLTSKYLKDNKINIIHDRVLHFMQSTDKKYDAIYFDIFPRDPTSFPDEVKILTKASKDILKSNGKIMFWRQYPPLEL